MTDYRVKEQLINATLSYLKKQPYEEVYGLINMFMSCKSIEEEKKPEK